VRRELGLVVQFGNKGSYQGIALAMPPAALAANGFRALKNSALGGAALSALR
jgi:hypothetical protein